MLRPNKNVERKLITATLVQLSRHFDMKKYRYVGFGSMWFEDFVLLHKQLGICDMVTIEREVSRRKRVEFNKPYSCIEVVMKDASIALGELRADKPSIIWLDYDGTLSSALNGDIRTAVGTALPGSIVLVTVNSNVRQLDGNMRDGEMLSPRDYLLDICDGDDLAEKAEAVSRNGFPELVRAILHRRLNSAILEQRPGIEYCPIWSFQYADDSEMVTIGGMLCGPTEAQVLRDSNIQQLDFVSPTTAFEIRLPILTQKEKRSLDQLLPYINPPDLDSLDFEIKQAELDAYRRFYIEYPVFNEATR